MLDSSHFKSLVFFSVSSHILLSVWVFFPISGDVPAELDVHAVAGRSAGPPPSREIGQSRRKRLAPSRQSADRRRAQAR